MKYKLPWHVRQYVKKELLDYKKNKKLLSSLESSHEILIVKLRLEKIETVFNSLSKEDREVAELIFLEKCSQPAAEINNNVGRWTYYDVMNKVIYLTAVELDMI